MKKTSAKVPLISIIVLSWNKLAETKQCLASIEKLIYTNYELIVVDNGSTDGSKAYLSKLPNITYVDNAVNRGFTGGHIDGLKQARGEFILIFNNDALIDPNYLTLAIKHFEDPKVAAVGGRAYLWDESHPAYNTTSPYYAFQDINPRTGEGIFRQTDNGFPEVVNSVSGSCVLLRTSFLEEYGYFYNPFFAYFEETDLFARMKRACYDIIYDPALHIWHEGGKSSSSYFQYHQLLRNRFIFAVRNFETAALPGFLKSYLRLGLPCLWRQFKRNEQQIMHRAYAKAFLSSFVLWPKHVRSRLSLTKQLGKSSYNQQLLREQVRISFVCDASIWEPEAINSLITTWLPKLRSHPQHELNIVTTYSADVFSALDATTNNLIRIIKDVGIFTNQALNLGWLCARNPWIFCLDPTCGTTNSPALSELVQAIAASKSYDYLDYSPAAGGGRHIVIHRSLLERCGGVQLPVGSGGGFCQIFLQEYARQTKRGVRLELSAESVTYKQLPACNDRQLEKQVRDAAHRDHEAFDDHGPWKTFLLRHRHFKQVVDLIRWLTSGKIPLRLKLGRMRAILRDCFKLNRRAVADQLQHIRNEVFKTHGLNRFFHEQNKSTHRKLNELLAKESWADIPVFVICRDRLEPLEVLLGALEKLGLKKIVLIDNDSAYLPLLDFYSRTNFQVCSTGRNVGHTSPWTSGFIKTLVPDDFYIVTDPDVIAIEACLPNALHYLLGLHKKYFWYQKIGFGLKIDDLPDGYTLKDKVIAWESQFWKPDHLLEPGVFAVPLDTTFALYKPFNYQYFLIPSLRTGAPYVARHLPWYADSSKVSDEEQYYRDRANLLVTTWSGDELHERYLREIERMKTAD